MFSIRIYGEQIQLHKACGERKIYDYLDNWRNSCTFALVSAATIKYGEKSGNDFVNSIIFHTFEDRNN